ncbi:hypothetical protein, partial [Mesorhizobium sp. M1A.F.Ca.IN.020.06.1.1]|uniref:hypothetical protein n=1 Tax=Mesorhizobium sp. M1A.F.Ca.IN.020.06.1.1 TaxID=2496765 RepID=UPI0019D4DCE2
LLGIFSWPDLCSKANLVWLLIERSARQRSAKPSSRECVPSDGDFSPCQASASAVTGAAGGRSKDE